MFRNYLIFACFAVAAISCDVQRPELMNKTHDAEGLDFTINVKTFPSRRSLNKYLEKKGYSEQEVDGLARWAITPGNKKPRRCDVFVIEPSHEADHARQEDWGHELMHCVYGSFHKEGVR